METKIKTIFYYWLPLICYCLFIYIQSSFPSAENLPAFFLKDKILHFAAYAILGILFFRAFSTLRIIDGAAFIPLLSISSSTIYGISDEVHQYFVPQRNADILDCLADMLGSICGVIFYRYLLFRLTKNSNLSCKHHFNP